MFCGITSNWKDTKVQENHSDLLSKSENSAGKKVKAIEKLRFNYIFAEENAVKKLWKIISSGQ